jgi:hypothetical protein
MCLLAGRASSGGARESSLRATLAIVIACDKREAFIARQRKRRSNPFFSGPPWIASLRSQ